MHKLLSSVVERVRSACQDGTPLALAVSGGVDSMALLHMLAGAGRWPLAVLHFNHRLRGEESDEDQKLVERVARSLGARCLIGSEDVGPYCKANRLSLEEGARCLRHAFLARGLKETASEALVLAHHADDQVETSLANFIRGGGPRGLAGMSSWDAERRLMRPLLGLTKAELIDYAVSCGVEWREDASNASDEHDRNWMRNFLIPAIEERRPGFRRVALRATEQFAGLHDFVSATAKSWMTEQASIAPRDGCMFQIEALLSLHPALQAEVIAQTWASVYGSRHGYSSRRVDEVLRWMRADRNGCSVFFGPECRLLNRNGWVSTAEPEPVASLSV